MTRLPDLSSPSSLSPKLSEADDEIDLRELAASILAGWKVVLLVLFLAVAGAVTYALNAPPRYEAKAVFELKSQGSSSRIPQEYAGLALMAGVSLGGEQSKGVFDRLVGRDFILRLSSDLRLEDDEFFNPTGPTGPVAPMSVAGLKRALGLEPEDERDADPANQVVRTYLKNVKVTPTKNGSIEVVVTHADAAAAAAIANGIVARVVRELADEEKREQREQLLYLSDQLADALAEMETTKKAVADFALANSLASSSAFAARSELMFNLREDLRRTNDMARAVDALAETMAASPSPSAAEYLVLKARTPVIDDVDFRRLIGVPEALDAWAWPPRERLGDFASTLADRAARIERSIDELRREAELYAQSTEQLAELQREATVAEATYNVLIEQVKVQTLIAGYQGDFARIYQSATPPELRASPKRALITALGGVLGLFAGMGLALVAAFRSGRLHTMSAIADAVGARMVLAAPSLWRASWRGRAPLSARLERINDVSLTDLFVDHAAAAPKVTIIAASSGALSPVHAALWLALRRKDRRQRVAVLLLGCAPPKGLMDGVGPAPEGMAAHTFEGVDVLTTVDDAALLRAITSDELHATMTQADARHDVVIIAAGHRYASIVARAFVRHKPYMIVLARPGSTRRKDIGAMTSVMVPDALVGVV